MFDPSFSYQTHHNISRLCCRSHGHVQEYLKFTQKAISTEIVFIFYFRIETHKMMYRYESRTGVTLIGFSMQSLFNIHK